MSVRFLKHVVTVVLLSAGVAAVTAGGCALSSEGTLAPSGTKCSEDATCDDTNPCTQDACDADGLCAHVAVGDGPAPPAFQTAADCKKVVCSAGFAASEPDDSDEADDDNDCTKDACQAGEPVHQNDDGKPCTQGKAQGVCAAGACAVECGSGLPPCDDGESCTADQCDAAGGTCVFAPLPGQPCPGVEDQPGDCRTPLCNQEGTCPSQDLGGTVNDTDIPGDDNDCTEDVCTEGGPQNLPLPAGTSCATKGGKVCDSEGLGLCVQCNTPDDCTGLPPDDACKTRACVSHACVVEKQPDGTLVPGQPAGDCHVLSCKGGDIVDDIDDADVLVDNNPCTEDTCSGGVPDNPPEPLNEPCGEAPQVCDGKGACKGCVVAETCLGSDDECKKRACVDSTCVFQFTPEGTPLATQTSGDCLQLECDGQGNVEAVLANSDIPPDDGNPCSNETCSAGNPQHPPKPANTPCDQNGGKVCNANGQCVQCNDAVLHCPAPAVCKAALCTGGKCTVTNLGAGTLAQEQKAFDCTVNKCDGQGNVAPSPDDGDLPVDGKECTSDLCSGGAPSNPPLSKGTSCGGAGSGQSCDGQGNCKLTEGKPCGSAADCASGFCTDGVCCNVACTAPCKLCSLANQLGKCSNVPQLLEDNSPANACTGTSSCDGNGFCKKDSGQTCGGDGDCASGNCVDGYCCNSTCGGTCQSCDGKKTGDANGTCLPIVAGQEDDLPACNGASSCDGSGACKLDDGQGCTTNAECVGAKCVDGFCCESSCSATCKACSKALTGQADGKCMNIVALVEDVSAAVTCTGKSSCNGSGQCESDNGETCGVDGDCAGGKCVDGRCCEGPCSDTCKACSKALTGKNDGVCADIKVGLEDGVLCTGVNSCDGAGSCKLDDGQGCAAEGECASGHCEDGVCCDEACGGACQACKNAQTGKPTGTCDFVLSGKEDAGCTGTKSCDGAGACKDDNGVACAGPGTCVSNKCADGVCCDTGCTGVCHACATGLTGKPDGTCAPVKVGLEDDNPVCNGAKSCNGAGLCKNDSGQTCAANGDCATGLCVTEPANTKVCCDDVCADKCESCLGAKTGGADGQCLPIPAGTDPDDECVDPATCNASQLCQ